MRTLRILFGVGALVALLGLNVAFADIKNESAIQPMFPLDTGDGSSLSPISFDTANSNEAQQTCAMTPGSPSFNQLLAEPIVPVQDTAQLTQYENLSSVDSQGVGSFNPPPRRDVPPPMRRDTPPPSTPKKVVTPEPATMVLVGLGIGGMAVVASRRWKKGNR